MKAALYLRVSTLEQAIEGNSIDAQKKRLTSFAESQDWTIHDFYIDDGYSAKDLKRPDMQRMISDLESKKIDVILVYKLDRLVRSVADLHHLLELFDKHDVKFKSATETFDTTTAMGRFFINLVASMAAWERETIGERVRMGMEEKALKGGWNGSQAPFGYDLVDGSLVINPEEAKCVRMIFDMYKRIGTGNIARQLNRMNIHSRYGRWSQTGIAYLLRNITYTGKVQWHGKNGNVIITEGKHEAIISEELFEETNKRLSTRKMRKGGATSTYIFSGVLRCARCGGKMSGSSYMYRGTKIKTYRCAEATFASCTMRRIQERALIEEFLKQIDINIDSIKNEVVIEEEKTDVPKPDFSKELAAIKKRKHKWQEAFAADAIDVIKFKELMKEEEEKEQAIYEQMVEPETPEPRLSKEEIAEQLQQFREFWDVTDDMSKKDFISEMFASITIDASSTAKGRGKRIPVEITNVEYNT